MAFAPPVLPREDCCSGTVLVWFVGWFDGLNVGDTSGSEKKEEGASNFGALKLGADIIRTARATCPV